jgi:CubicO group peptidase (beta-lactamase class C family)
VAAPQPLIAQHLRRYPLAREPGSRFVYSNTGYLTLAAVIEEAAGRGYEEYCRAAVLTPLGVRSAYLHADRRLSSGSGGWSITGADYLAFLDVFDPRHPLLGEAVQQWIAAARTRWGANRRGGWYSLGVQTSASGAGRQVQHNGLLFLHGKPRRDRASALALRSFARRKASGDGLFIAVTQMRAKRESLRDLIAAVEATFPDARA